MFQMKKAVLCLGIVLGGCLMGCGRGSEDMEFVEQMGTGWNLGNSLESTCEDGSFKGLELECYWQNPKTTREMIKKIKEGGFETIRIPVTWDVHMDESGTIDEAWMDRVGEVVDMAYEEGLYVILDAHHDSWFVPSVENEENGGAWMKTVWGQIAERFADYDSRLLFEGMNEPRLVGTEMEWQGEGAENDRIVEEWNQIFVDTVRAAGANNAERYLLVTTYADSVESLDGFQMPEGEHLILTVHAYKPYSFAMDEAGGSQWEDSMEEEIDGFMETLRDGYTDRGIPVIIGEFGAIDKDNTDQREQWLTYYIQKAKECSLMYIWWDEGGPAGETAGRYRIFDRESQSWLFPSLKDLLVKKEL